MTDNESAIAATGSQELGVMEGKGFYNKHSRPQHSAVAFGLPLLERAVEAVPLPGPGEVFRVADYGVAGGHNSMQPVRTIIEGIESSSEISLPDPFWPEYEHSRDAQAFGTDYAEFFRAAFEPSRFGALDADRSPQERKKIAATFDASLQEKVAADPATAKCTWHVALLLLARK